MTITKLAEYLSCVPDVVWSGLIASALTLGGVLISNGSNTARLKAQLAHDATEKSKERTGKLRQEVYLLVAEELGKANRFLGSLASVDLTNEGATKEMSGLFSAIAKLQLVAEPDTALLVSELNAEYGAATLRLLTASGQLRNSRIEIDLATKFYEESLEKSKHYSAVMDEMTDLGSVDKGAYDQIKKRHEIYVAQTDRWTQESNDLWAKHHQQQLDFTSVLISEMKPLSKKFVSAMMAIRGDLGLSTEPQKFEEQMSRQWEQMEEELNKALNAMSA